MATEKEPNGALARVVAQAGLSNTSLAARVSVEARRRGIRATPDHVSVKRWLEGMRPHDETIRCVAAVLSAKLGREISPAEIGFELKRRPIPGEAVADSARYPAEASTAVALLDNLASADMTNSPDVTRADWASQAASSVITQYLFSSPVWGIESPLLASTGGSAERIRSFVRHLMELDFQFGGGHTRRLLLFYFRNEIVPLLGQHHSDQIRREIFSAAAEAAQLLGWSAYDAGRHGAAQRYFMQGLRLSQEAGDLVFGGRLLSNLSHQANYLGRYSEALQFARAAQSSAARQATPTVNAMFLAMEARALASMGESQACAQVLHCAEQAFAQNSPDNDPPWIAYFDALELAGEAAHCFRELGRPNETQMFAAQAIDPVGTPPRTRALVSMVTAAGAFNAGDLDEALSLATSAISLTGSLESSRYVRYLTDFHRSVIEKHAANLSVREFTALLARTYPDLRLAGDGA